MHRAAGMASPLRLAPRADVRVRQDASLRPSAAGFTLLEMMVVMCIVGIVATLATLQLTRNPRRDLFDQSRHLAAQFEAAGDEAALRSKLIAWEPVPGGYRFEIRDDKRHWQVLSDPVLSEGSWQSPLTSVEIHYGEPDGTSSRIIFGIEPIGVPVRVMLHSSLGDILISGGGDGRFHAEQVR